MLVMQTKHHFMIGNKCVFLNFKAQGKKYSIQLISRSNTESSAFSVQFFFILQEMATKIGQITLVLEHNRMS